MLADGIAMLFQDLGALDVESDEQVGYPHSGAAAGDFPGDGDFAQHQGGVRVPQVPAERCLMGRGVEAAGVHHIVTGWKVGEFRDGDRRRRLCCEGYIH